MATETRPLPSTGGAKGNGGSDGGIPPIEAGMEIGGEIGGGARAEWPDDRLDSCACGASCDGWWRLGLPGSSCAGSACTAGERRATPASFSGLPDAPLPGAAPWAAERSRGVSPPRALSSIRGVVGARGDSSPRALSPIRAVGARSS